MTRVKRTAIPDSTRRAQIEDHIDDLVRDFGGGGARAAALGRRITELVELAILTREPEEVEKP